MLWISCLVVIVAYMTSLCHAVVVLTWSVSENFKKKNKLSLVFIIVL